MFLFRISKTAIFKIIPKVCQALISSLREYIKDDAEVIKHGNYVLNLRSVFGFTDTPDTLGMVIYL
ncbi:hypothetical protein PR048_016318 [Dryococelus australis]|uniref:Uncharacterized protein n=1 Tax=Dryococelus australis TaxID=614101 RepID=A0ABQ9HJD7_9NEOP|nr:hypothetical protein PR048_016318 [Dryococelus australis]